MVTTSDDVLQSDTSAIMQAMADIGKKDGLKGYWKGNLPQVLDVPNHPWLILQSCADSYPSPLTCPGHSHNSLQRGATLLV